MVVGMGGGGLCLSGHYEAFPTKHCYGNKAVFILGGVCLNTFALFVARYSTGKKKTKGNQYFSQIAKL